MKLTINDNVFKVKLAVTPSNIKKGMMGQRFNDEFNGMYFLFQKKDNLCFWMYQCVIPLDIIIIDGNIITEIYHDCEPCKVEEDCESYCGIGDRVLEIAGGSCDELDINVGDKISFSVL